MINKDLIMWIISTLSLIVGFIGIFLACKFRRKKILQFSYPIKAKIFSNEFVEVENFNLTLNGKPVRDLFLFEIKIENKGTETLNEKDFIKPIKIIFNKEVNLFPISIKRKKSDIPIKYDYGNIDRKTFFLVETPMIEPNDVLSFNIIYESDSYAKYDLECRIINGKVKHKYYYEEDIDENFHYKIYRKYKGPRKTLSMILTAIMFIIIMLPLKKLFPQFFLASDLPFYLKLIKFIFPIILLSPLILFSMIIVDKYFNKKIEKEISEQEEFIKNREKILKIK